MDSTARTMRNRLTRMKIGECILKMLDKIPLADIRVSNIAEAAGISRMTFYHYYDTKEKALVDYLAEIIETYAAEAEKRGIAHKFHTREHLEFTFQFFSRYDRYLLRLERIGCFNLLLDGINQFLETNYKKHFEASMYSLYFYAGALLNVFMKWLHNGKKESVSEIARIIMANSPELSF